LISDTVPEQPTSNSTIHQLGYFCQAIIATVTWGTVSNPISVSESKEWWRKNRAAREITLVPIGKEEIPRRKTTPIISNWCAYQKLMGEPFRLNPDEEQLFTVTAKILLTLIG
jgi:hypothetical protein